MFSLVHSNFCATNRAFNKVHRCTGPAQTGIYASAERGPEDSVPLPLLRRAAAVSTPDEALDVLLASGVDAVDEKLCHELIIVCIERNNVDLALEMFQAMTGSQARFGSLSWPPASVETASDVAIRFCRTLNLEAAIQVIMSVKRRGLPTAHAVQFGDVVSNPFITGKPLTVMQPLEGIKTVVDSYSRYQFEVFSGNVISTASESLVSDQKLGTALLRAFRLLSSPPISAVHTLVVETPSGQARSFRVGTETANVPAKVGDRVSVICAPQNARKAQFSLLKASPPRTKPGEPLALTNHTMRYHVQLLAPSAVTGLPDWIIPGIAAFVIADAISSVVDPVLPLIGAGAAAATVAAVQGTTTVVLPTLKQLPLDVLEQQALRQNLLCQRMQLEERLSELVSCSVEDVKTLSRLCQLSAKMATVDATGTYDSRQERVAAAKRSIEMRLLKNLELINGYSRVINMIEIEVEMETDVPRAEIAGIEKQIEALNEVEDLQTEWRIQAEAQDEIERLLRAG